MVRVSGYLLVALFLNLFVFDVLSEKSDEGTLGEKTDYEDNYDLNDRLDDMPKGGTEEEDQNEGFTDWDAHEYDSEHMVDTYDDEVEKETMKKDDVEDGNDDISKDELHNTFDAGNDETNEDESKENDKSVDSDEDNEDVESVDDNDMTNDHDDDEGVDDSEIKDKDDMTGSDDEKDADEDTDNEDADEDTDNENDENDMQKKDDDISNKDIGANDKKDEETDSEENEDTSDDDGNEEEETDKVSDKHDTDDELDVAADETDSYDKSLSSEAYQDDSFLKNEYNTGDDNDEDDRDDSKNEDKGEQGADDYNHEDVDDYNDEEQTSFREDEQLDNFAASKDASEEPSSDTLASESVDSKVMNFTDNHPVIVGAILGSVVVMGLVAVLTLLTIVCRMMLKKQGFKRLKNADEFSSQTPIYIKKKSLSKDPICEV